MNRCLATVEHARGDRKELNLRFRFLYSGHQGRAALFNNPAFRSFNPLRKDLLDPFIQPVPRFQLSSLFLLRLLSFPEQ